MITHADRIKELEAEGCTNSEAHDVANAEAYEGLLACDDCGKREAGSNGIADEFGVMNYCAPCFARRVQRA